MEEYLIISNANFLLRVASEQIAYVCSEGSYCNLRLTNGDEYTFSFNLVAFEKKIVEQLAQTAHFFARVGRNYIINSQHIFSINLNTSELILYNERFVKHVRLAQRIMDDIIDLESEKIEKILAKIDSDPETNEVKQTERHLWEKIQKKTLQGRRTGVGITAEGDMLAALNLRYGTEEATEFSEEVHKIVALHAYRSSVQMAKERGAFEIYSTEREANNPFINRLREADPALYEDMKKYGRRNIACLTIAPTGTTSLMTQTTSGIEPVFLPVYKRRRKVNPNDTQVRIDFVGR
jgi:ribonucleoside-diphosphate reductase alpha chain